MIKKLLIFILFLTACYASQAQLNTVKDGRPRDSTIFTLEHFDSLNHVKQRLRIDTAGTSLWQIGTNNFKPFFSISPDTSVAIMTDTASPYPINANEAFLLRIETIPNINVIVGFKHKYQTTPTHDGGIIEFSFDGGLNWHNALDSCNMDSFATAKGIHTENFYTKKDTLLNGEPAFNGSSNGWISSRIQFGNFSTPFYSNSPFKPVCIAPDADTILLRFRFVSDDTLESLDGWIIDDIKIEHDIYFGYVADVADGKPLSIYPNPSSGIFHFPSLKNEQQYNVQVYDRLGKLLYNEPYKQELDMREYAQGLYYYKVSNGEYQLTGTLSIQ